MGKREIRTALSRHPKVRDLLRVLRAKGCMPTRQGATSHEIWLTPGGRTFSINTKHQNDEVTIAVLKVVRRTLWIEGIEI